MATFRKKGNGWEAAICRKGIRRSKTFNTKSEAKGWADQVIREIDDGLAGKIPNKTFGDLLREYQQRVVPGKRGWKFESLRIDAFCRDQIAAVMLAELSSNHFATWRDRRLKQVSAGSVLREINILSHAINTAIKDWGWLKVNPLSSIRRPPEPQPRNRLINDDELERLLLALGYDYDMQPVTISSRIGAALLFAIETAMRAGEIAGLTWDRVNIDKRTALLVETKNGTRREVPLSTEAIRIINQVRIDSDSVFNLTPDQIDINFRKAKARAMIDDLHWHDSRATAITRLAKRVDVLTLAKISGHKDLKMLQIYYRETAEDIAKRLG